MNKIFTLILSCIVFGSLTAQSEWVKGGQVVSGTELSVSHTKLDTTLGVKDLYFKNTGTDTLKFKFSREIVELNTSIGAEQWCYTEGQVGLCIPINPQGVSNWVQTTVRTLAPNDSVHIEYKSVGTGNHACNISKLVMLNSADDSELAHVNVKLIFGDCSLSIPELQDSYDISAYPNPANDIARIKIAMSNNANAELVIVDMLGKQVYNRKVAGSNTNVDVNTADFNQGIYFYSLKVNNQIIETKKLVVKH